MSEQGHWLETNEAEDLAGSLRHAVACCGLMQDDVQAWKWLLLSLHAALQGACVAHLCSTTIPIGVVSDRDAEAWLQYFDALRSGHETKWPDTKVLELPKLLKKLRKSNSIGCGDGSPGVALTDSELSLLVRIHEEIRNQFVHFSPGIWAIELSGTHKIVKLVVRIVRDISLAGWAFRHQSNDWHDALNRSLQALQNFQLTTSINHGSERMKASLRGEPTPKIGDRGTRE